MQTYLPYPDENKSAAVLDTRRLNNQVNEALIALRTLTGWYRRERGTTGWANHPAVKMWAGCEKALACYGLACLRAYETRRRETFPLREDCFFEAIGRRSVVSMPADYPVWWGRPDFHAAHRAVLLAKDYAYYSRFGWCETPAEKVDGRWPYVWPA